ncbi:malectin (di-glucose binding ER protein) [Yoonia maricola]|uniref:Malectin (Di-glucose binding ER protein) n=1 Tax=Yoonia maricola TaxID=420999 RepID=A0A2M8W2U2_9RHOB|nr:malectin domain-containing carbohydrate-binding protein [Yoonia maricola]PJI85262.1 malectin (di-glucose binding ER protein) [Yoonia maricola]
MYELTVGESSPLAVATYDPTTGALYLEFDWDKLLNTDGNWGNARHIDAVTFEGNAYPIEIHADDGPRNPDGSYIYSRDTMENIFTIDIGTGHDPADGTLDFGLSDRADGSIQLYNFALEDGDSEPAEQPDGLVYALNAGGGEYTASNGVTYAADDLANIRSWTTSNAISGTEDDTLYQSERSELSGGFTYEIAVENGTYDLELNFAEIWNGAQNTGVRVMDIYVEGNLVIDDLDISDDAGYLAALDIMTEVTVSDGSLTIEADGEVQNAKLSAFSLWETEAPTDPVLVYALNAGGDEYTAENGVVYQADDLANVRSWTTSAAIAGTTDDTLYQSERSELSGDFTYDIAVANGTYDVELNFAEIWGGAIDAGVRVFDIYVEDELIFDNLDISDEAGFATAFDLVGQVEVTDGALTISTSAEVQNAKIAGFSIWEATEVTDAGFTVGSLDDLSF